MDQVVARASAGAKFSDPDVTAKGERRAHVALEGLQTLWLNTGTLCNLACAGCYIESSPRNDRLEFLTRGEARGFLDEIARDGLPTRLVGFTGGEPFLNPELPGMLADVLERGLSALVLTNAMRPMRKMEAVLVALRLAHGDRLRLRVSLDHYAALLHEAERGPRSWQPSLDGLLWLAANGFAVDVAARLLGPEPEAALRAGFADLFARHALPVDAADPARLVVFPEMDATRDTPEITEACWGILHRSPGSVMCASARMVVKRRGAPGPSVVACTLLPYDERFDLGPTLAGASGAVSLNHPHCATFCVLGGAACSAG